MIHSDPVIEAVELSQLPNSVLLDVRDASTSMDDKVQGAVSVPVQQWIEDAREEKTSFENVEFWERQIAELGLSNQTTAVIFDDGRMTEAARVWFILQFFGAKAMVLNGGVDSLRRGTGGFTIVKPSETPLPFRASLHAGSVGLVDRHTLKDSLNGTTVYDARTQSEFDGKDLKNNSRGGHLPGAKLLPHSDLLEAGRLRDPAALRALLSRIGFQAGDHLVTHCDGGGRAALAAIAAVRAGFEDVNVYYMSFSDWAKDESCPII